jgi:hypothetical protein
MPRATYTLVSVVLAAALFSGCVPIIPGSVMPFYPIDDPGVEVENFDGRWYGPSGETIDVGRNVVDKYNPGDYVLHFKSPLPYDEQQAQLNKPQDHVFYCHAFKVGDQTYLDISEQSPSGGRGDWSNPDMEIKPGERPNFQPHMLTRLTSSADSVTFQIMDSQWFNDYLQKHPGEVHMRPGGGGSGDRDGAELQQTLFEDNAESVWNFLSKHENDGLWGMAIPMTRTPSVHLE